MTQKTSNPHGIITPSTVEEFRRNLKRYYVTIRDDQLTDHLVTSGKNIPINDISSFRDIYKITRSGWWGDGSSPQITPMITFIKDPRVYMKETNQFPSNRGFFQEESNFIIWNDLVEFVSRGEPMWYSLDNQWIREFYMMTLGEYSGYVFKTEEVS